MIAVRADLTGNCGWRANTHERHELQGDPKKMSNSLRRNLSAWLTIRDQCQEAGVAFFMKQLATSTGRKIHLEDFP